jgi:hypothetical protein
MPQDMKNFSDITAIDISQSLDLRIEYKLHGHCEAMVIVNDDTLLQPGVTNMTIGLFEAVSLKIKLVDFKEGSSGLEIVNFSINGLEILPKYQHLASRPTNYIDFYAEWSIEIPSNFYVWYHEISGQGWIA